MSLQRRLAAAALTVVIALGGVACGDDPGEDQIGDGEVNDQGD